MSVALNNAIVRDEFVYPPAVGVQVPSPYRNGFYVLADGDVTFTYSVDGKMSAQHTKSFLAGDTWFADEIYSVDSATGGSISLIRLKK